MNRRQRNSIAMMMATDHVLNKYKSEIETIPAMATEATKFQTQLNEINQVLLIQEGKITGTTEQKQKEEQDMVSATIRLASGLYVFALDNSNFELSEKVDFSPSELSTMGQTKLLASCSIVLEAAKVHSENLADYGISSESISQLESEIADFKNIMAGPRSGIVTRSEATTRLEELVKSQATILNDKMDKLILMFKSTNQTFYNEYKSARIIVNLGGKQTSIDEAA